MRTGRSRLLAFVGTGSLAAAAGLFGFVLFDDPAPAPTLWVAAAEPDVADRPNATSPTTVASASAPPDSPPPATSEPGAPAAASTQSAGASQPADPSGSEQDGRPAPTTPSSNAAPAAPATSSPPPAPTSTDAPPIVERSRPLRLSSSRIDVDDFPVRPVGLEDDGRLEVPDETEIGWYELGAAPGDPGVTVLAAHVSWNRTLGPFAFLGDLRVGDVLHVDREDGGRMAYEVVSVEMYPKTDLPPDLWRNVGDEQLALITCGGEFDESINRFEDNIVVVAEPVEPG